MADIENIYRLSPMQSGMLFHVLYDTSELNPYVAQSVDEFTGPLDPGVLRRAWQSVVDRHTVLRTAFVWEGLDEPLQVVQQRVDLPFTELDWTGGGDHEALIGQLLERDRARGFDLGTAPLLRLTVARCAADRWVVLWSFHHLLLDGWSAQLLQKEVFARYRALAAGQAAALPEPIPYARFIAWLGQQSRESAEEFWREELAGFASASALGVDRETGEAGYGDVAVELGGELASALRDFARSARVTANTVVQGAWGLLLARYGGTEDVVFGSTVSGRPAGLPGAEAMVGLFINTLPVRVPAADDVPVGEWLARLQERQAVLRQFDYTSLADIQSWSAIPKGERLFHSILVFENYPKTLGGADLPDGLTRSPRGGVARTGYPLTLGVTHTDDSLWVDLSYDRALFGRAAAERMVAHFRAVLAGLIAHRDGRLGGIEPVAGGERAQLERWGASFDGGDDEGTLHGRVERWAAGGGADRAVVFGGAELSYAQLDARANRLARLLRSRGVGRGDLVGVCLERGVEMVVALLAVLKSGAAYVPLDPDAPRQRLAFLVEDTAAAAVVTDASLADRLPDGRIVVRVDADAREIERCSAQPLDGGAGPDDLAYVIHTSGSTGTPKGVLVSHRNVLNRFAGTAGIFAFGTGDVWTHFHSFTFDFSVWEIWGALVHGGTLVVVDRETTRNAEAFCRLLVERKVTVLSQTPSAFALLQQVVDASRAAELALRLVVFGGEALHPARLAPWWEAVGDGGPRLVNMYGITETTVHVTWRETTRGDVALRGVSPIGVPLADTPVLVLDARGRMVPVGVAGELWVGGAGVTRGYLHRAELTAQRFVRRDAGRFYRSGDLVRWSPDGELEYLGRIDDQVKVRGFRIEPGEVEAVLERHPAIAAAAALVREDVPGDPRLVAYAVPATGTRPTVTELREHCAHHLPDHMLPTAFAYVEDIPLTANGKADRRALAATQGEQPHLATEFVAPRDEVEQALAQVWADVLGAERVGVHDNFFDLGGDSILSIQVISRAIRHGLTLTPRMIFQHQTVAGIVARERQAIAAAAPRPERPQAAAATEYGLSAMQSGLLFHALDDTSGLNPYVVQFADRFTGPLDVERLRDAWQAVVDRHTVLRTEFLWDRLDEPVQVVRTRVALPFTEVDWRGSSAPEQRELLARLLREDRSAGFDLASAPLMRLTVARLSARQTVVLWSFHHLLLDGWSAQLVQKEVFALYRAALTGRDAGLAPAIPYARYIEWADRQPREEAEVFWKGVVGGFGSPTPLGAGHATGESGFADVTREFGAEVSAKVRAFARRHRITPNTVAQAAWALVLARYAGTDDVVYGTTVSGRPAGLPDVESMVGLFINTLPVRVRTPADARVGDWLRGLQEQLVQGPQYSWTPLSDITGWSSVPKGQRLFSTIFSFQNFPALRDADLPDGLVRTTEGSVERTGYPLTALVFDHVRLKIAVAYDRSLFDRATVEQVAGHVETLLGSLVADPDARLGDLEMMGGAERQRILVEWNTTAAVHGDDGTLHGRVEHWARERPGAVALVCGGERLTYRELNARANRWAHALRRRGVGPGVLVGVCLERGADLVVALLAVLKAGGAYVPLDPGYPVERLAFMVADTGAGAVLTRSRLRDRLPHDCAALCLDADPDGTGGADPGDPVSGAGPRDLAYVIYTSGSTGTPKGVQVEHRSVLNRFRGTDGDFAFGPDDVWPLFHSSAFDLSVWEIWGALTYGGRLVVVDQDTTRNAAAFAALLAEQEVTVLTQTPSAFHLLQQAVDRRVARELALRLVVFAGEALLPSRLRSWWEAFAGGGPRLVNMYGITETTIHATVREITPADGGPEGVSPIGVPLADTQMFVLDPSGAPVPAGVVGELWVGGAGLARGYLNRPELMAERFVRREIGGVSRRLYRSGDLVRWSPDGELFYHGRIDDQVKVRGFRIEPAEVEAVLERHPAITAAAALVREDVPGDRRLVAYAVPATGTRPSVTELREHCARGLPDHMLPTAFAYVEHIPLTANGKVDRRALAATPGEQPRSATHFVAPRDEVERILAQVWADVLGAERVGVHDNFFDLGGDSILSIQVISRVRRHGLRLTSRMIFQHETVAEVASRLREGGIVQAEQGRVSGAVELTPIQSWFFEQEFADFGHFNQSRMLAAEGIDADVLERAVALVVDHHDALSLRFTCEDGVWRQYSDAAAVPPPLSRCDATGLPDAELPRRTGAFADALHRSLDLARGPLLRAGFIDLGPGRGQRILLAVHHLAVDTVSWQILLEDLAHAYEALAAGRAVRLPLKTTSFRTWAQRLVRHTAALQPSAEPAARAHPPAHRPLPRDRQGGNTFATVASATAALDEDETRSVLQEVPRAFGVRINDVILTSVARAVRAWTGQDAISVDLEGHGREDLFPDVDLSRTVGWFTALYPVDIRLEPGASPGESLRSVRKQTSSVPGNGIGYGLLRHLGPPRVRERLRSRGTPEISVNYLGQGGNRTGVLGTFADPSEPRGLSVDPRARRAHLIDIVAAVRDGRLSVTGFYSRAVHDAGTAEKLVAGIAGALRELVREARPRPAVRRPAGRTAAPATLPMTPIQVGMMFHSLDDTSGDRPYLAQTVDEYTGPFDTGAFRRAWQRVSDRHTALRSSFVWEDVEEPYQVIAPRIEVEVTELDWREHPAAGHADRLARLLADDRERGFALDRAAPFRFTVVRAGEDRTVVLWTFHHLLLDGWSAQLVQKEFYAFYRAETEGGGASARTESGLGAPVPYARYVEWLEGRPRSEAEEYWRGYLAGFEAPTPLGVDRATGLHGYGDVMRTIEGEAAARLGAFARDHRITPNTVLQGAWALLLARYADSEDVLYGSTVSGRPAELPDIESMVGLFINTLPVRAAVPGGSGVLDWLRGLQERHSELRQYEYSSLSDVQRCSAVPTGEPLFRSILVFENYPKLLSAADLPAGLRRKRLGYVERTGYPLVLGAAYTGEQLDLHLVHDRGMIDDAAAERMVGHLQRLLNGIVAAGPRTRLADLSPLTEEESRQFARWNGARLPYPDVPVHELIERQARRTPDAIAVDFEDELLTYRELNERANQLAHRLRAMGVGPQAVVGLCVERGPGMITALLGIMKSGGAYVPLDTRHPADRLAYMIEETAAPVVVTQRHLAGRLPAHGPAYLWLDADAAAPAAGPVADPEPLSAPGDLAYVIFTSGSTGLPKGVMIEHRSMSDRVQEMRRQYRLTADDAYLQFSSVTFDGSVGEIFPALIAGARLVPRGDDWTPATVLETIRAKGITVCQLPPFVWNALISELTDATRLGGRLRLMSMGGERVLPASVERWFRRTTVPLFNIYGPTETTVNMTTCLLTGPTATVPIGAPVANTDVLVVDRAGRPAPSGVPGELWIGGKGVARGYLNRPELTAERFVPDPLSGDPRARMYRTGDLVRWLPDGQLEFLGRIDDQVKLRGFRIEPGEIESALTSHPRVGAAVVLVREDDPGARRLVAYVVPVAGERPEQADLREWCARTMPEYMVPGVFVLLDALPATANGKGVDRKALPAPDPVRPELDTGYAEPSEGAESVLAEIWREVLGIDRVGAHDNFFALGGDSHLGMRVIAAARRRGLRLSPRLLFQNPTIAELAPKAAVPGRPAPAAGAGAEPPARRVTVLGSAGAGRDTRVAAVDLNGSTARRTVFAFHEGGGNVSGYLHLAELLAPVARVVGIESRSVAFGVEPEDDVAAMARGYWAAVRALQPAGPYLLAGYSFGGALALQTAALAAEAGERVALLVALDSCLPAADTVGLIERDHSAAAELLERLAGPVPAGAEPSGRVGELMRFLHLPADMLDLPRAELVAHLRTMEAHIRAARRFTPPAAACPVLLYQAEDSPWPVPIAGSWTPFVGAVDARTAPGDHLGFLRPPHVGVLARGIAEAIAEHTR